MTREEAKKVISTVLEQVQETSGKARPSISDHLCPLRDLEGFDSLVGLVATGYVATSIGFDIPNDVNLFVDRKRPLTLHEAADKLCNTLAKAETAP